MRSFLCLCGLRDHIHVIQGKNPQIHLLLRHLTKLKQKLE
jgi:hypothetical protein